MKKLVIDRLPENTFAKKETCWASCRTRWLEKQKKTDTSGKPPKYPLF